MKLEHALAIVHTVVGEAGAPVSVFVADSHGELVAAATMDGAAPDTRLNAQRKAYTAARSDALSTRDLAEKVKDDPVERASFDPFFTFFQGGVAAFEGGRRVGCGRREWPRGRRRRPMARSGAHAGRARRRRVSESAATDRPRGRPAAALGSCHPVRCGLAEGWTRAPQSSAIAGASVSWYSDSRRGAPGSPLLQLRAYRRSAASSSSARARSSPAARRTQHGAVARAHEIDEASGARPSKRIGRRSQ